MTTIAVIKNLPGLDDLGREKPKELFLRGRWPVIAPDQVAAVVGSRRMTGYGERVVQKLVAELVGRGMMVLSGLMYGVDKTAHRACLAMGGKTAAVLGWGINEPMKSDDRNLADQIVNAGGAVISEWDRQTGALWTFPRRDRIMAALAGRIYVVEAAERSGALITAEWGIKLGREIWAVPGPVTSPVSAGTNKLIAEGKAKMWTEILKEDKHDRCSTKEADIYHMLQCETLSIDELGIKLNRPVAEVSARVSLLMLTGRIREKDGKYFAG